MKLQWCQIKEMKNYNSLVVPRIYTSDSSSVWFLVLKENYEEFLLIFVESEVFIYQINLSLFNDNRCHLNKQNVSYVYELSLIQHTTNSLESKMPFIQTENFLFKSKPRLDFISQNDTISNLKLNKHSCKKIKHQENLILLSTEKGEVFIISINVYDYFIDVVFNFNISQNFLHEYEMLDFEDMNVLLTIDKHLFLYEIYSRNYEKSYIRNKTNLSIGKNLIMRIDYIDEKIIDACIKNKQYIIIFTNKMIYLINLNNDGSHEILFKKEANDVNLSSSGVVDIYHDNIYYIKSDNSFCVHPIYEPQNKFTITINSRNQLNKLNFYKVIFANEEMIAIINRNYTEIYFFNNKYKLINRESILLESSRFLFTETCAIVISYNHLSMSIRYKLGLILKENSELKNESVRLGINSKDLISNKKDNPNACSTPFNQTLSDDFNLNEIEDSYVDFNQKLKQKKQIIKVNINEINNCIKIFFSRNNSLFSFHELFLDFKSEIYFKLNELNKIKLNIIKISNSIFASVIKFYVFFHGSYSLRITEKILNEKYFKSIYRDKIIGLMKIPNKTKDFEVMKELVIYLQDN